MLYEFVELAPFSEVRDSLFTEKEYSDLQIFFCGKPEILFQGLPVAENYAGNQKGKASRAAQGSFIFCDWLQAELF
jgi:hypothetical protein